MAMNCCAKHHLTLNVFSKVAASDLKSYGHGICSFWYLGIAPSSFSLVSSICFPLQHFQPFYVRSSDDYCFSINPTKTGLHNLKQQNSHFTDEHTESRRRYLPKGHSHKEGDGMSKWEFWLEPWHFLFYTPFIHIHFPMTPYYKKCDFMIETDNICYVLVA